MTPHPAGIVASVPPTDATQWRGLQEFAIHYNATWLVARHGYRTPNQVRAEQLSLAQRLPTHLRLAA
ncbi:hypothetical protein [Belnapia moabensis]|uniref:hypothetical protein n=1 Tax=Belnapia moabensis TaxID=365533 RepID=UPI0012EE24BE|nr:hypothetical protein [Belnapia moabensis]